VEKPMTTSEEKSEELVKIVEDSDQILSVGYIFLYHPVYTEISSIVDAEGIDYLRCDWRKTGSFSDNLMSTLTCHDLAIAHSFARTEVDEFSVQDKVRDSGRMDILELDVDFRNFRFSGSYNRIYPGKEKSVTLRTDENNLYTLKEDKLYAFDRDSQKFEEVFEAEKEPLRLEIEAFLDCVENRKTPRTNALFGYEVDKMISEIETDI
jgi:UDP-2-acetamido-3-amino-2,3-dideoxy-glucuronate N-acetyltransferase